MKELTEISRIHRLTDCFLQEHEARAWTPKSLAQWARQRRRNDQAFFLMLFARFEDAIASKCARVIATTNGKRSHAQRALGMLDAERMTFMQKVGLLTPKGGRSYNHIGQLYDVRCDIAHGKFQTVGVFNMSAVHESLQGLASELKLGR